MSVPSTRNPPGAAAAFTDGLGERLRARGADGRPLEVLKLRPEFMDAPNFEAALRERTARLAAFRDPSFGRAVRIDRVPPLVTTLAIVSERVEGPRLSHVLEEVAAGRRDLPFVTATAWLHQIVSAMTRLHAYAREVAHGALAPERVVLTADGRIVIVESVLGSALEQLQWSRRRLWLAVRSAMPPSAGMLRFDQRADLAQIGATALAILLGRPLRDEDYPEELPLVLREVSDRVARANPMLAPGFASWLVRLLQVEGRAFGSLKEALAALEDLLTPAQRPVAAPFEAPPQAHEAASVSGAPPAVVQPAASASAIAPPPRPAPAAHVAAPVPRQPQAASAPPALRSPVRESRPTSTAVQSTTVARPIPAVESWPTVIRVALVLVAIGATTTAGTVRYLAGRTAGDRSARAAAVAQPPQDSRTRARRPAMPAPVGPVSVPAATAVLTPLPAEAPPDSPRGGWLTVRAPVDVVVSIGGEHIGETRQGRFPLAAGVHRIEIVNDTLGLRQAHRVVIRSGEEAVLAVQLPFGVVDLNAIPWAEVWLDGQRLGETPIGSLSVPLGPHEFVFRHPELGERRYAISVTAAGPVRLSVDLTKR